MEKKSTNTSITLCPKCKGEGVEYIFKGDSDEPEQCSFCQGKRVVIKTETIEYLVVKDI